MQNIPHRSIIPLSAIAYYLTTVPKLGISLLEGLVSPTSKVPRKPFNDVDSWLRIAKSLVRRAHARRIGLVEGRHPLLKPYAGLLIKLSQWIRRPGVTAYNRETNELLSIAVGVALLLCFNRFHLKTVLCFAVFYRFTDEDKVLSVCCRIQRKMESFRIDEFFFRN